MERSNKMAAIADVSERREVCEFDQVIMYVNGIMNKVQITQGEQESLTIEGRPDILSKITTVVRGRALFIRFDGNWIDKLGFALSTSLTRSTVRYTLTVKDLAGLDLTGLVHAQLAELHANNLRLSLKGAGDVAIGWLTAQSLDVDLQGVGRIELDGQVDAQRVSIDGPGHYKALNLKSLRARVSLKGLGRADIWAVDRLDVKVRGLGHVGVRGVPKIRKDIAPRVPSPTFGPM
jgi:hypothetical protein